MTQEVVVPFAFESSATIRTVLRDGEPWFVAADVCAAIGVNDVSVAVSHLATDEKELCDTSITRTTQSRARKTQTMWFVSESGLYALILRSHDAIKEGTVAYRFRRWVTKELLPTIRKTGTYNLPQQPPAPTALPPYEPYSEPGAHGVYLGHDGKGKEEPYYIDEPLRDPDEERYAQHCAKNQQTDVRIMRPLVKRAMERQIREGIIPDRFVPGVVGFEWSARYIEMSRDKIGLQRDQPSLQQIN